MLGMVQKKLYRNTLTGGEVGGGGESIDHIRMCSRLKGFVQSHITLFTKRNYLAFFEYCAREACTDTCNGKRVGRSN